MGCGFQALCQRLVGLVGAEVDVGGQVARIDVLLPFAAGVEADDGQRDAPGLQGLGE
ncbi:hypothetical protein D3C78_1841920 [compost metagenome]